MPEAWIVCACVVSGEQCLLVPARVAQVVEDVAEVRPVAIDEERAVGVGGERVASREQGSEVRVGHRG